MRQKSSWRGLHKTGHGPEPVIYISSSAEKSEGNEATKSEEYVKGPTGVCGVPCLVQLHKMIDKEHLRRRFMEENRLDDNGAGSSENTTTLCSEASASLSKRRRHIVDEDDESLSGSDPTFSGSSGGVGGDSRGVSSLNVQQLELLDNSNTGHETCNGFTKCTTFNGDIWLCMNKTVAVGHRLFEEVKAFGCTMLRSW